jgi:hypothetical protein
LEPQESLAASKQNAPHLCLFVLEYKVGMTGRRNPEVAYLTLDPYLKEFLFQTVADKVCNLAYRIWLDIYQIESNSVRSIEKIKEFITIISNYDKTILFHIILRINPSEYFVKPFFYFSIPYVLVDKDPFACYCLWIIVSCILLKGDRLWPGTDIEGLWPEWL